MSKKLIGVIVHMLGWFTFLFLPYLFSPAPPEGAGRIPFFFLVSNIFLIPFFYFNAYYLVPHLLFTKKYFQYFLVLFILLVIFLNVQDLIRAQMPPANMPRFGSPGMQPGPPAGGIFRKMPVILYFSIVSLLSIMIRIIERWQLAEKKTSEIELEKVNTELSYLKLQINPHFLFNTLNNIYSLATVESPKTPAAVMKLSDIMRYVTQDAQADFVQLDKEINYVSSYIELQKMRTNDKLRLTFETSGNFAETRIAPLLLISFVENAFKYGVSSHEHSTIEIHIHELNGELTMTVKNKLFERKLVNTGSNIGLANTRRRLELLYPGRHSVDVQKKDSHYMVTLKIQLHD